MLLDIVKIRDETNNPSIQAKSGIRRELFSHFADFNHWRGRLYNCYVSTIALSHSGESFELSGSATLLSSTVEVVDDSSWLVTITCRVAFNQSSTKSSKFK